MAGKAKELVLKAKKFPFGIVAGACGMVVFFATFGLIVAYVVLAGIAGQTSDTAAFIENWWQGLLLAVDIIAAVAAVASLVMYILKKAYTKDEEIAEETENAEEK